MLIAAEYQRTGRAHIVFSLNEWDIIFIATRNRKECAFEIGRILSLAIIINCYIGSFSITGKYYLNILSYPISFCRNYIFPFPIINIKEHFCGCVYRLRDFRVGFILRISSPYHTLLHQNSINRIS